VPLSEHEQRLLEQMERALYAEDPKFASSLRGKDPRSAFRRSVLISSVGFVAGVVLLMTGLVKQTPVISVLGFVVMLGSAFFALTSYRRISNGTRLGVVDEAGAPRAVRTPRGSKPPTSKDRRRFMERLEERWNRRRDENGR
jgi:hypothetical protein